MKNTIIDTQNPPLEGRVIKTSPDDNVAIVVTPSGLKRGSIVMGTTVLLEDIPMGHKVALQSLETGDEVRRYGQVIGYATRTIEKGSWVNEGNISLPEPPKLEDIKFIASPVARSLFFPAGLEEASFMGYRNADGSVGTKNVLAITTSVQCVAGITNYIENKIRKELLPLYPNVDDVVAFNHSYGCGIAIDAPGAIVPIRTIKNITQNPNFGGEVMIIGLGCEKLRPEKIAPMLGEGERPSSTSKTNALRVFMKWWTGLWKWQKRTFKNSTNVDVLPAPFLIWWWECNAAEATLFRA